LPWASTDPVLIVTQTLYPFTEAFTLLWLLTLALLPYRTSAGKLTEPANRTGTSSYLDAMLNGLSSTSKDTAHGGSKQGAETVR